MQLKMGDFWQLMFPARCPVCDGILFPGDMICQECKTRIKVIEGAVCSKCGKPLSDERREYCSDCVKKRHPYQQGKARSRDLCTGSSTATKENMPHFMPGQRQRDIKTGSRQKGSKQSLLSRCISGKSVCADIIRPKYLQGHLEQKLG